MFGRVLGEPLGRVPVLGRDALLGRSAVLALGRELPLDRLEVPLLGRELAFDRVPFDACDERLIDGLRDADDRLCAEREVPDPRDPGPRALTSLRRRIVRAKALNNTMDRCMIPTFSTSYSVMTMVSRVCYRSRLSAVDDHFVDIGQQFAGEGPLRGLQRERIVVHVGHNVDARYLATVGG